jgi:hypothetical protein
MSCSYGLDVHHCTATTTNKGRRAPLPPGSTGCTPSFGPTGFHSSFVADFGEESIYAVFVVATGYCLALRLVDRPLTGRPGVSIPGRRRRTRRKVRSMGKDDKGLNARLLTGRALSNLSNLSNL